MCVIPELIGKRSAFQIPSLAAVAFPRELGIEPSIKELACERGIARSTIYRQAEQLHQDLQQIPRLKQKYQHLHHQNLALTTSTGTPKALEGRRSSPPFLRQLS